jgi:hypothetical protein
MNLDERTPPIPSVVFSDGPGRAVSVRSDFGRAGEGDLAMLHALREQLSGGGSARGIDPGPHDAFQYALLLLGEDA